MNIRLLDTNIVSYIIKKHTLEKVYRRHLRGYKYAVSFQTVGELREGALSANWGLRKQIELNDFLDDCIVFYSNLRVSEIWAEVRYQRRHRMIETADAWIAATALAYQLELVTHNPADFAGIAGLGVISEAP